MPLIRKIIDVGKTSRGVILPKSWLEYVEKTSGQPIENVAIEVNDILKLSPIFPTTQEDPTTVLKSRNEHQQDCKKGD